MTINIQDYITLELGESYVSCFKIVGTKLYVGTRVAGGTGRIIEIDLTTFQKTRICNVESGAGNVESLEYDGTYLYAAMYSGPGIIYKIDLNTFTWISKVTFIVGETSPRSIKIVGNYIYAGLNSTPAKIVKVNLSTFMRESALDLSIGEDYLQSNIVSDGQYIYCSTYTIPIKVVKIDISTFTKVSSITLTNPGDNHARHNRILGNYLIVGTYYGRLIRIDLNNFTQFDSYNVDTNSIMSSEIVGTDMYITLFTTSTLPPKLIKVDTNTHTVTDFVETWHVPTSTSWMGLYPIIKDNNYLYVGTSTDPSDILRISINEVPPITSTNNTLIVIGAMIGLFGIIYFLDKNKGK